MKKIKFLKIFIAVAILSVVFFTCKEKDTGNYSEPGKITVKINHVLDNQPITVNRVYQNPQGEDYTIDKFQYYISNIKLIGNQNQTFDNQYFLIDGLSTNNEIALDAKKGVYNSLEVHIGIDSVRNVSGSQSGVLDPVKGMFWTWNSGYIALKLEGKSPQAQTVGNSYEYHIGGFRSPYETLRKIRIPLNQNVAVDGTAKTIELNFDLNKFWSSRNQLKISQNPVIISSGPQAVICADNYQNCISFKSVY